MPLRTFAPSSDERVIAGICAGIARTLAVDPTLVRLVFALLALAGGAGIVLYLALWAWASGRRAWVAGLLALVALVLVAVAIFVAVFDVHVGRGIGERNYVVTNVQELRDDYRLGIGSLELDLSRLELPVGETRVETSVDVGDLEVIVPADAALRIHGTADAGEIDLPNGIGGDGRNVDVDLSETGDRVLVLDADVGAGSIRVERAVR